MTGRIMIVVIVLAIWMFGAPALFPVSDDSTKIEVDSATVFDNSSDLENRIKTIYDVQTGRPTNQSQTNKGYHIASGSVTFNGDGCDTVSINSSTADSKQDLTFIGQTSYWGRAWSLDGSNSNRYWIVPISGNKFEVRSSDSTDTGTVRFVVEGE